RFRELGDRPEVQFVFIFENKGKEIGVTLSHPHGQIYAYPFIPPVIERELAGCWKHYEDRGECLLCRILSDEVADGRRIVAENGGFVALIPFFARYPYEVHILPREHRPAITDFDADGKRDLAQILQTVIL